MKRRSSIWAWGILFISGLAQGAGWTSKPQPISQNGSTIDYSLYIPETTVGKLYPLVVELHGNGGGPLALKGESDLGKAVSSAAMQTKHPAFFMGPATPQTGNLLCWLGTCWGQNQVDLKDADETIVMKLVIAGIHDLVGKYPIDTNRIYINGGSMGGYGTWGIIQYHPTLFAAATPLSGGGDTGPVRINGIKHLPIWAFANPNDGLCPVWGSRNMTAALRAAGNFSKYSEFNVNDGGFNHIWSQIWNPQDKFYYTPEHLEWMFRQAKSASVPAKVTGVTATALDYNSIKLTWTPAMDAVGDAKRIHYFIYRQGRQVGLTDSTTFVETDTSLHELTNYKYTVVAYNDNSYLAPPSDEAGATTTADLTPPKVLSALGGIDSTQIIVRFDERMEKSSAEIAANYAISGGFTVTSALLNPDKFSVTLTASKLVKEMNYGVTVNNVRDAGVAHVSITKNNTAAFIFVTGITKIRFLPRGDADQRMVGGVFEGTNGDKDAGPYTEIFTVTVVPKEDQWTEVTSLRNSGEFRYVRYRNNPSSHCNVAEIEFYRGENKLTGDHFGSPGSLENSGMDGSKAFDGDATTFFDAPETTSDPTTGLDLAGAPIKTLRIEPLSRNKTTSGKQFFSLSWPVTFDFAAEGTKGPIHVFLYNMKGEPLGNVKALKKAAGTYSVVIHGRDAFGRSLPPGKYCVRIVGNAVEFSRSFLIVRIPGALL